MYRERWIAERQRVAMKCCDTHWTTNGESTIQLNTDAEGRNRRSQRGLDTLVVYEDNDVH